MSCISYIIPHFNSFESVMQLIESIDLRGEDEIIIIDDCSTDDSYSLLSNIKNKIKLIQCRQNSGAGHARNLGIKSAKNKWLVFADADDYFIDGYRDIIEEHADENSDIIYFSPTSKKISKNKSVIGDRHSFYCHYINKYLEEDTLSNLNQVKYKMVVPWSKMVNKEFIIANEIWFDEVSVSNDIMFATKIGYYAKNIKVSNEIIYCCLETDNSLTADTSFQKVCKRLPIFADQYNFLKTNLDKNEFKKLNITGTAFLIQSFRSKYNLGQIRYVSNFMRQNNIPLFSMNYFFSRVKRSILK